MRTVSGVKPVHELSGIEILRFVCALSVIMWHYHQFFFSGPFDTAAVDAIHARLPFHSTLFFFYDNGSLSVEFFWAISGFIFYWHYASAIANGATQFRDFAVRRFSRLYPLHFATLLLVAILQYLYYRSHGVTFIYSWNKPIWFVSQLLFASNWFSRQPPTFNGPIWSVSVEVLVYLIFFVVARRFGAAILVAGSCAAVAAVLHSIVQHPVNPDVFECAMYFFAGGVAQRLSMSPLAFPIAATIVAALSASLAVGVLHVSSGALLLLAASSVIVFEKLGKTAVLSAPFGRVAFLGNATYSSYLLHFPLQLILVLVVDRLGWSRDIFYSRTAFVVFFSLVICVSLFTYRSFELPAQNFFRRILKPSAKKMSVALVSQ